MIKASELRLGNLVYELTSGQFREVSQWDYEADSFDLLEPIPLTEEWLLKFGFKQWKDCKRWSSKTVLIYTNRTELFYYGKARTRICIEYVHQLQNLCFVLAGEELTLTDKNKEE